MNISNFKQVEILSRLVQPTALREELSIIYSIHVYFLNS